MKKKTLFVVVISLVLTIVVLPAYATAKAFSTVEKLEAIERHQTELTTNPNECLNGSLVNSETTTEAGFTENGAISSSAEQNQQVEELQEDTDTSSMPENKSPSSKEEQRESLVEHPAILQEIVIVKNQITEEFVKTIGNQAKKIAYDYDLYASVMIAQAILESGSGNSKLSIAPHYNLFGIKGNYQGATVIMKTQEDDGKGNLFTIDSAFRQYPSYNESLEDYARLLEGGLVGNSEFYGGAWKSKTKNYQEATAFLTGKYATDSQYAEKLDQLIEVYELAYYDDWKKVNESQKSEIKIARETNKKAVKAVKIRNIRKLISKEIQTKKAQKQKEKERIRKLVYGLSYYFVEILTFM